MEELIKIMLKACEKLEDTEFCKAEIKEIESGEKDSMEVYETLVKKYGKEKLDKAFEEIEKE